MSDTATNTDRHTDTWNPILESGRNAWRIEQADRFAVIVDGADYFRAFAEACEQAEHQILILGWDFDRHEDLYHGTQASELPSQLGPFLRSLIKRKKTLRVFLLSWDFNMIYAVNRELLPALRLRLAIPPRFHFRLDGRHPTGGSQHQKIVVIDDKVAFCGGIDLTRRRWDTPDHVENNAHRVDANGDAYAPFHDLMIAVSGPAAAALGDLARYRWRRARGWRIRKCKESHGLPWPASLTADVENVSVGISRTFPAYRQFKAIFEIKWLHIDAIMAARQFIYIENQYLTSAALGKALDTRLREPDGPEVVIVLPEKTGGWLEQVTMDVLRSRIIKELIKADKFDRLRVYFPHQDGLDTDCIHVHAKLLIVDDCLLRIGSANASNRSMGLDSECDLTLESKQKGDAISLHIQALRHRLLAEHLDCKQEDFYDTEIKQKTLIASIDTFLKPKGRSLRALDCTITDDIDHMVPDDKLIDPAEPYSPESFSKAYIPQVGRREGRMRLVALGALVLCMLLIAALWRWTPMQHYLDPAFLGAQLDALPNEGWRAIVAIGGVTFLTLFMVPVTLMGLLAGIIFGSWKAFVYVYLGALFSSFISYAIGQFTGHAVIKRMSGSRIERLSRRIANHGTVAVALLRVMPIAPFSIINVVAGASHLKFQQYFFGTLLGMAPGLIVITLFSGSLWEAVKAPSLTNIGIALGTASLLLLFARWSRRWLRT